MDKAILYNVTLEKINNRIQELKTIGFNMDEFERIKKEIIAKNNIEVKKSYNFSSPNLSLGQTAFLEQDYTNSITELEKLYAKLLDYEIYVMAYHTTKLVKEFLKSDSKSIEDFTIYRKKIEQILNHLHNSKTIDYDVEGPVIEEIYKVVYLFIKEEIKQYCDSALLDKLGEIDKFYIDKLVRKDIEQIDLNKEKNVNLKVNEIASKGFNATFANKELIMTIVNTDNAIFIKRKISLNELDKKLNDYLEYINELYNNLYYIVQPTDKKKKIISLTKNSLKLFLNYVAIASVAFGAIKIGKYKTTTNLRVLDYGPVNADGKRTVTEYDLSDYQNLSFEELYNIDLNSLMIPKNTNILENEDIYLDSLTNEAFKIIRRIEVNLEDTKETWIIDNQRQLLFIVLSYLLSFIYLITELALFGFSDYAPFISDIQGIYNDLNELTIHKITEKEYQKKLRNIVNKLNNLITENKDIFAKANSYITYLESNEKYSEDINNLKRKLTLIKSKEKDITDNCYNALK